MAKGDGLSPFKLYDTFLKWSCEVTSQIKNVVSPLLPNLWPLNFKGLRFRVRGSHLPNHITTWLQVHFTNGKFR